LSGRFGNNSAIDQALDTLIDSNLSHEALSAAEIDIKDLENKVASYNTQEKRSKLVLRIIESFILVGATYLHYSQYKLHNVVAYKITSNSDKGKTLININLITSILVELIGMALVIRKQNSSYKDSARMKKLEKLKQIIEDAKSKNAGDVATELAV